MDLQNTDSADRRLGERFPLKLPDRLRLVLIGSDSREEEIFGIQDISEKGIALYLADEPKDGSQVKLQYASADMRFEVFGVVVWHGRTNNDASGAAYVAGIALHSSTLLDSFLQAGASRHELR